MSKLIQYSNNPRPSSKPFISGDTFRSMADFIFDETQTFNPEDVYENSIVFVKTDYLKDFFKKVHPLIKNKYKIIAHNSDSSVSEDIVDFIDEKVIALYSQNVLVKNEKIIPIPIGLENLKYFNNGVPGNYKKIISKDVIKKDKILFGFSIQTNEKERKPLYDLLKKSKISEEVSVKKSSDYLKVLREYKFVAAPEGNGPDTHRLWEAILLETIPIVKRNVFLDFFHEKGLPLLFVKELEELKYFTEDKIKDKYEEIMNNCNPDYKKMMLHDYWVEIIRSKDKL